MWVLLTLVLWCAFREENILLLVGFKGAMEVHGMSVCPRLSGEVRVECSIVWFQVDIVLTPPRHSESKKARDK